MYWWVELPFTGITTEWKSGLKEDMKFNKLKYKILHLGQEVIHEKVKQWCTGLWSSLPKEILGIPVYSRLKIGQNYDYHSLGYISKNISASKSKSFSILHGSYQGVSKTLCPILDTGKTSISRRDSVEGHCDSSWGWTMNTMKTWWMRWERGIWSYSA